MAKTVLLECDKCGSSEKVLNLSANIEKEWSIDLDLCKGCWQNLFNTYHARIKPVEVARRVFEVVDEEDIT